VPNEIIVGPYSLQTPIPFVQIKGIGFVYTKYRFFKIVQMAQLSLWVVIIYVVSKIEIHDFHYFLFPSVFANHILS